MKSVLGAVAVIVFLTALAACTGKNARAGLDGENLERNFSGLSHLELASEYFIEANNALRRGDSATALRFFETAFILDTASEIVRNRIIDIALSAGFPASAVRAIHRGRNVSEIEDGDLRRLTAIFLRHHAYPQAFEAVSAVREKSRNDSMLIARIAMAENLANLGAIFNAREQYDSAIIAFGNILALGIRTPEILFGLGVASERTKDIASAERFFRETLAMNPRHALAANYLGYMWAERGINLEEARALITVALEEEPDNGAYLDSYGWVLYQLGFFADALPPLLRAAELIDDDYVVFYHLARVYLQLGDRQSALENFRRANTFENNPDFERIAEFILDLSQ